MYVCILSAGSGLSCIVCERVHNSDVTVCIIVVLKKKKGNGLGCIFLVRAFVCTTRIYILRLSILFKMRIGLCIRFRFLQYCVKMNVQKY